MGLLKKVLLFLTVSAILLLVFYPLREPVPSYSTVLNDRDGGLLGASIALDGQWRFPKPDSVPHRIATCIQYYEDKHFYRHPGVNPLAIGRALWQNILEGEVVSGASTLTMQIARMMRQKNRTLWQKTIEIILAIKLEIKYSKEELMIKYASMAPFGGNVVGLDAASWRYFNRPPYLLSWGESASLAVLPNNPGAIFPGRSKNQYQQKRDLLLKRLLANEIIDTTTYELSILEELPGAPFPIPQNAPHLLSTLQKKSSGKIIHSTIDPKWQRQASQILERHHLRHSENGIENAALIVIDLESSEVLAYVGNTNDRRAQGHDVDIIQRPRSPGSSLKPLLYAKALTSGVILENTLLPDIPTFFGGFSPKNFSRGYDGAVPANQALIKSLNIPFTYLLRDYTYEQFHLDLQKLGITSLNQPPGHYGLSLILGGGEVSLWELSNAYLKMYQRLADDRLSDATIERIRERSNIENIEFDQGAIWQTLKTITELSRPAGEESWQSYSSSQLISWKTGTSFGFRDAWAIGMNGKVLVGVWVGNADGEGRAGLTGINTAAPLFLEVMRLSGHDQNWLAKLKPELMRKAVCEASGYLASELCPSVSAEVMANAEKVGRCPYHRSLLLDETGEFRINSSCYSLSNAQKRTKFLLPPSIGHFYKKKHPDYPGVPAFYPGCNSGDSKPIEIVYPNNGNKLFIPTELNGEKGRVILKATHQDQSATLYWSIGDVYLGSTEDDHKLEVFLNKGRHCLKVVDELGNETQVTFEVLNNPN